MAILAGRVAVTNSFTTIHKWRLASVEAGITRTLDLPGTLTAGAIGVTGRYIAAAAATDRMPGMARVFNSAGGEPVGFEHR